VKGGAGSVGLWILLAVVIFVAYEAAVGNLDKVWQAAFGHAATAKGSTGVTSNSGGSATPKSQSKSQAGNTGGQVVGGSGGPSGGGGGGTYLRPVP